MRIPRGKNSAEQGNMILVCVMFSVVLGITIASYLLLVRSQFISASRSYNWNVAMSLAEAGVEDALALVNKNVGDFTHLKNWPATAAVDHWDVNGNVFHMQRTLDATLGYYNVWITNLDSAVAIRAEGTATWDTTNPDPSENGGNVRKLLARASLKPLFSMAAAAVNTIDLNNNPILVDSYDSADPLHSRWNTNSTFGVYDPTRRKDGGSLGANGNVFAIAPSGMKIYGNVYTGPGGTITIQQNGSVGDMMWNQPGIQPGHASDDMNVDWPPVQLPPAAAGFTSLMTGSGTININTNGSYRVIDTIGLQQSLTVNASNVVLYLEHGLDYSSGGQTLQVTTNSSLTIYAAEQFVVDRGSAIMSTNAGNLFLYGLTNLPAISLESGANFTGCIYAPQSDLFVGDNHWHSGPYFLNGSVTARTITANDPVNLSYDENLRRIGSGPGGNIPARAFVVTNWTEL